MSPRCACGRAGHSAHVPRRGAEARAPRDWRLNVRNVLASTLLLAVAALAGCGNTSSTPPWTSCGGAPMLAISPAPFYIYISPRGNDANAGSEEAPVATLRRAQDILVEARPASDVIIRIRGDEGPYDGQSVIWEYWNAEYNTTFESYPDSTYASFRQGDADTTFFVLAASAGRPTNLHFRRISVEGYTAGAIWFLGSAGD